MVLKTTLLIHTKVDNATKNESTVARDLKRKRDKEDSEEGDCDVQDDKSNLKRAEKEREDAVKAALDRKKGKRKSDAITESDVEDKDNGEEKRKHGRHKKKEEAAAKEIQTDEDKPDRKCVCVCRAHR